jgi:hypothetical protein
MGRRPHAFLSGCVDSARIREERIVMKKLRLKDRWLLVAGVLGGVAIGTSLIALVRVLRRRSESEDEAGAEGSQARGEEDEGDRPLRRRRHGRHGDRRAKAGVSEDRGTADTSQSASSAQRH